MAGVGRVFQGVEYPSRREACQARHWEYVRALADGLNFTQSAHAVGVSKRTGKVWRNGRTRSSGRCERASIAPQAHWYRLYMNCQPHRVSKSSPSWVLTCTFATRTHPGNAVPTRIRTGSCANTCPKAPTSHPLTETDLDAIANQLNDRLRKTLNWDIAKQRLELLLRA